jgi:7,8-dihydropterin-6-yl-methyl-4-(beta-D-ribofuranosyl)aminobenzene 5'-phosphate synthase
VAPASADDNPTSSANYEIINLYDAFGHDREGTTHSFGFSALIRYGDTTILFDAGTSSDILERNAEALGVDLGQVDIAIASHAHANHVGGFDALIRANDQAKIYFPTDFLGAGGPFSFGIAGRDPAAAEELPREHRYFAGESSTAELITDGRFYKRVEYVEGSREIAPGVHLVATTSTNLGYFSKYPGIAIDGSALEGDASFLGLPELSLALDVDAGQVLVVGCSHSGVEAIVRQSREELGSDIALLVGGYHLLPYERPTLEALAARLSGELGVKQVAPAHCTGHLGFLALMEAFGDRYRFFGLGSRIRG